MDSIKLSPEIEQYIQETDKNRNYSQFTPDKRSKGEKEREFFISKFPRSEIRDIKMLDYVQGKRVNGNPDPETFSTLTTLLNGKSEPLFLSTVIIGYTYSKPTVAAMEGTEII